MVELLGGRDLEPAHVDTLRVDAAHDVSNGSVLAACVERLQTYEHAVGVLCGESRLVLRQHLHARLQQFLALLLVDEVGAVARVEVAPEIDRAAGLHSQWLDRLRDALASFVGHSRSSDRRWRDRSPAQQISQFLLEQDGDEALHARLGVPVPEDVRRARREVGLVCVVLGAQS